LEQERETRQVVLQEKQSTKLNNNYGYLTSIKEFNESQENMITEQTTSPSNQVEFTSLRCDENEHIELNQQDESSRKEQHLLAEAKREAALQDSEVSSPTSAQCEENFGS